MTWNPPETVPRAGERFLALSDIKQPDNRIVVAYSDPKGRIRSTPGDWAVPSFIGWMELPDEQA